MEVERSISSVMVKNKSFNSMKERLFGLILVSLCWWSTSTPSIAQITIQEQPEVSEIMDIFTKVGKEEPYLDGWRIKIISTTDRRQLENTRKLFNTLYPEMPYELAHQSPYYSMIVGAFETRISLEPILNIFKKDFAGAIPFRDRIMKVELFDQP